MPATIDELSLYLHLSRVCWKKKRMSDRDRLLVLSGITAAQLGLAPISAYCRNLILENNPGHMVRRWPSFKYALNDADFLFFLKQVHRKFPREYAESMLAGFGVDRSNERETYYTDVEYAASILGVELQWLLDQFESPEK